MRKRGAAVNLPPFISCWLSSDRRANTKKKGTNKKRRRFFERVEQRRRNIKREGRNGKTE
jgi:hypothetical protein